MAETDFAALLERDVLPFPAAGSAVPDRHEPPSPMLLAGLRALVGHTAMGPVPNATARDRIEDTIAELDRKLAEQVNLILHHPEFQQIEATWRGLRFLVLSADGEPTLVIRAYSISKRELNRTLRKYHGTAWDQSPLFKKIYEEEYGQLGGRPYGVLVGDYYFDHRPEDMQLLSAISQIAAAAHAPFIAAAAPSVMQMDSWAELANPRDLTRIFQTPEYAAWRSLRATEDARYLGLCLPRFLARLPYGVRTEPVETFDFEEEVEGPDASRFLWANAAYAMATNIARAFRLYGWCVRIRGIETGGAVESLPIYMFPTADGDVDRHCSVEVALSERRESELAQNGFMPLVHCKGTEFAAFVAAPSLQRALEYDDPAATANANLSARLPYVFACCRFAHYLKCMVRDKIGTSRDKEALTAMLEKWLYRYVDGSPERSTDEWKAAHPLVEARVVLDDVADLPGQYSARFFLRPHYQLEGMTAVLRLLSRMPTT